MWREITEQVNPPRAAFVRHVLGAPLGEPGQPDLQRRLLEDALGLLTSIQRPGAIVELPYVWKRDPELRARQSLA